MKTKCYRPTALNVYETIDGKKIVRRHYWKNYKNLENHLHEIGETKRIHLNKYEKEKYDIKNDTPIVRCTYSGIIPCGQCKACLETKARKLTDRIILDIQETNTIPYMLTITYNDENIPKPPLLNKEDAKKLIQDLKKDFPTIKYLLAGEYGSHNGRPHYHVIIWNITGLEKKIKPTIPRMSGTDYITYEADNPYWNKGNTYISKNGKPGTIQYVAQYAEKKRMRTKEEKAKWKENGLIPEFQIMTKGIAYNYYETHKEELIKNKGKYVDETHHIKQVDKSFIDWYKRRYGELDATTLYEIEATTYIEREDNQKIRDQREKNAKNNIIGKERL